MKYLMSAVILVLSLYYLYENGTIFENFESLEAKQTMQLLKKEVNSSIIIDVRTKSEYENGHIKDSISIPIVEIEKEIKNLQGLKNYKIFVYCKSGKRSKMASKFLSNNGFVVYNIQDGYSELINSGFEEQK